MSLDRKILDRIERESLSIKPKWFFVVKNLVFGTGTLIATVLGSLSLALFFEVMALQGRNLTWLSVPYILAIAMVVFLILGYWIAKRVDYLYKLKFVSALSVLFFLSLTSGYLTYASGEAKKIERKMERIPVYAKMIPVEKELPIYHEERAERWKDREWRREEKRESSDEITSSHHHHHHSEDYADRRNDRNENKPDFRFEKECDADADKPSEEKQEVDKDEPIKGEVKGIMKESVKETAKEEIEEKDEPKEVDKKDTTSQKEDEPEDTESEAPDSD